jgi:transposase
MMEIKKRSPHYHRLDDYELRFHLSVTEMLSKLSGPRQSTKIHTTVDALGNPIGFHLTGGQACDLDGADVLLPQIEADIVLADKGFDADERVLMPLQNAGKTAVIPPKANRKVQRNYDKELYKDRHLIENFFAKLKLFRAIATRYDKTARNFLAAVHFAATLIWLI